MRPFPHPAAHERSLTPRSWRLSLARARCPYLLNRSEPEPMVGNAEPALVDPSRKHPICTWEPRRLARPMAGGDNPRMLSLKR